MVGAHAYKSLAMMRFGVHKTPKRSLIDMRFVAPRGENCECQTKHEGKRRPHAPQAFATERYWPNRWINMLRSSWRRGLAVTRRVAGGLSARRHEFFALITL